MEINEFIQMCRQLEELQQTRTIMEECLVLRPSEITAVRKWSEELIRTQKAFELACKVLDEHCCNSIYCIYECPLSNDCFNNKDFQSRFIRLSRWKNVLMEKAGEENDT